ncbi:MAG: carotenoid biosynthesis protein [Fimbriimonas sp.]
MTLGVGCFAAFEPLVRELGGRAWAALGVVLALGGSIEVAGVLTGFPFGRYAYTDRWWPVVTLVDGARFPLQLPFAWFLMAGASYLTVIWIGKGGHGKLYAPLTGLLAAALDLIMEPVMVGPLGYWRWLDPGPLPGGAPWSNFLGWFATAALAAVALNAFGAAKAWEAREPKVVLLGHMILTIGIGLALQ